MRQFYGHLEKMRSFCRKNRVRKIPRFWGGVLGGGGGGSADFIFMGARTFLKRRGCRICVTVRLPVRPRGETMHWQANSKSPLSVTVTPLLDVPEIPCKPIPPKLRGWQIHPQISGGGVSEIPSFTVLLQLPPPKFSR